MDERPADDEANHAAPAPTGEDAGRAVPRSTPDAVEPRSDEVEAFWALAREHAGLELMPGYFGPSTLASVPPPAWAFGGSPEQADELLELVLAGTKTATASAYWDFEAEGEPLPEPGGLSIVVDGGGHPRALLTTTEVQVVPFDQVTEEHAYAEGEDDRSLASWRRVHQEFFARFRAHDRETGPEMPVVCERFRVLYQQ